MKAREVILILMFLFISISVSNAEEVSSAKTNIAGVYETDEGYEGSVAHLEVEVKEGSGRVFVYTMPLTKVDTQVSARLAKEVACRELNRDCSNYDIFYIIKSENKIIGGPSAGASMAVATMSALSNKTLFTDVMASGTINPDGSLGSVGSMYEKAKVANENGANLFIIPKGQSEVYVESLGETINLKDYAASNWDLSVVEASSVRQAFKHYTGYKIEEQNVTSEEVSSKKFDSVMKSMSKSLREEAVENHDEAKEELSSYDFDSERVEKIEKIQEVINKSESELERGDKNREDGEYYSSASLYVRSQIYSRYASNLMSYYKEGENYLASELDGLKARINSFEEMFLSSRKLDSINDIEVYAVATDRLRDAESTLDRAYEAYGDDDYKRTAYLLAYGEVRKNTAYDWLLLKEGFEGDEEYTFDPENLKDLSQLRIEQSRSALTYANLLVDNDFIQKSRHHLQKAEKVYEEGNYVFALFQAHKARATAELGMSVRSDSSSELQSRIDYIEEDALRKISKSKEKGSIPILALSYLEYAKSLKDEEPVNSLMYLSYSKQFAEVSQELVSATTGRSRVITNVSGEQPGFEKYYRKEVVVGYKERLKDSIILIASGALFGALVTLYLMEENIFGKGGKKGE